jgi:hypothetical protein
MFRTRIAARSAAILFSATILSASPFMVGAASASPAAPQVCVTQAGYHFDNLVNHGLILDGKGVPKILHNGTKNSETLTFTQTASGTGQWSVNGSITATGGYDFEVIKASVSVTIGGSYTKSTTVSEQVSLKMTVPVGYYGILQGGVFRRYVTGHYYYVYGNCTVTKGSTIAVKLPFPNQGYDTTVNTTGKVPWDQQ